MVKMSNQISAVLLFALTAACGTTHYPNDGAFRDLGANGYTINFGPLDLSTKGTKRYTMARLPDVTLTIGLNILLRKQGSSFPPILESMPLRPVVSLFLKNSKSEVVIRQRAPLNEWIWSGSTFGLDSNRSFVYRSGMSYDMPVWPAWRDEVEIKHAGERQDGGWGSYFHPRQGETYFLEVSVLRP